LDAAGVDFTTLGNVENCCGRPCSSRQVGGLRRDHKEEYRRGQAAGRTRSFELPGLRHDVANVYPEWAAKSESSLASRPSTTASSYRTRSAGSSVSPERSIRSDLARLLPHRRVSAFTSRRAMSSGQSRVEFVEMTHHTTSHCCGSVLTLIKDPSSPRHR